MEVEGWEVMFVDIDLYYVYIDLMVVMFVLKLVVVCLECMDLKVIDWFKFKKIELIMVLF